MPLYIFLIASCYSNDTCKLHEYYSWHIPWSSCYPFSNFRIQCWSPQYVSISQCPDRSACRTLCQDFETAVDMSKAVLNIILDATDKQLSTENLVHISSALNISVSGTRNVWFKLRLAIRKHTQTIVHTGSEICSSASIQLQIAKRNVQVQPAITNAALPQLYDFLLWVGQRAS
jgi:hypothetical protein